MRSVKVLVWAWSLGAVVCVGSPAWAQTVTWVTAPPPVAPAGGQFTVEWEVAGFVNPLTQNAVAWGQTTLEGQTPDQPGGNAVYSAVVDVVPTPGPLFYAAFADSGTEFAFAPPVQVLVSQEMADLQAQVAALQTAVAAIQANSVLALDGALAMGTHNGLPVARFTGVNVQVVNGVDQGTINGLGNLLVGYDEPNTFGVPVCNDPQFDTQVDCEMNGAVWGANHKSGSHNLVAGGQNSYAGHSGVVFGQGNAVVELFTTVTGGLRNVANGRHASVTGGENNLARGGLSVVAGGSMNQSLFLWSTVSGGEENIAESGLASSVFGGQRNTASAGYATAVGGGGAGGGIRNTASGVLSVVVGGEGNVASGSRSAILGGLDNQAIGSAATVVAGRVNQATGNWSSVTGGRENVASADYATVSGGGGRAAVGIDDWVAGGLFQDN